MNEVVFVLWLMLWVILLVMAVIEKRGYVFGFLSGLWILFLGIYLILDGFQQQTGATVSVVSGVQTIQYSYSEIVAPFSGYSTMWAIPFLLLGIYIMYMVVTKKNIMPT